jgi:hypothetical protein
MYIKESEFVKITISDKSKTKWEKKIGSKIDGNDIEVHWSLLKGSTFRTMSIDLICDDCNIIYKRRIRDLDPDTKIHYCNKCFNKGERNGMFGKPCPEKTKFALKKWIDENGNPFTWESTKQKIRETKPWKKGMLKTTGQKRSEEVKLKMSEAAILAFKEGRRSPGSGWAKIHTKQYKGLDYQSKYELNFLKYLESKGKLDIIEKGPTISYFDMNGKEHMYFSDFKIKNTNIIFEIKSWYYWEKNREVNIIKKETASKIYDFYLIMDNNFTEIDNLIKYEKI